MGIISYLKATKGEFKHINWPTRKQSFVFTGLIVLITAFLAVVLGLVDWLFIRVVALFV
ncbi:MAG: SecE/Sec61-gamma subunit of protein translocation complex [Candidatus Parcubacteria bacterium]